MKHSLSAFAAIALFATGALAQPAPGAEHIAREYMAAYSAVDWDTMEGFLAGNAVFDDPTALGEDIGVDGLHHEGREAMMTALRAFADTYHPIELGFVWDTVFESNGRVVFMGEVNALYPTETEGQTFRWHAPQVTVITVRDGQVIQHQDYANYASPDQSLVLQ